MTCCITRDDLRFSNATKTFERPYLGFSRQLCCSQPCRVQNAQSNPSTIFAVGEISRPALMLSHHHLTPATAVSAAVLASWSSAALEQPLCTHRHTNADAQTEDQARGKNQMLCAQTYYRFSEIHLTTRHHPSFTQKASIRDLDHHSLCSKLL